jgi:hypothetical protein
VSIVTRIVGDPTLRTRIAAAAVALSAFAWGVFTLPRYGVTFDAPSLFYTGDRTLFFLTHPSTPFALDFMAPVEPVGFHSDFVLSPEITDPVNIPAFPGIVCAIANGIFHERLGWLNAIDGHHLGLVALHAIALFAYVVYGQRLIGLRGAVIGALLLALFPCALGHSFNNAKDWPSAQFYGVAVLSAGAAILDERPRGLLVAGAWLGVALAAKFNPVFAVVTLLLWVPLVYRARYRAGTPVPDAMVLAGLAFPVVGAVLFVLSWPWLYHGPVRDWPLNIFQYLFYMISHGVGGSHPPSSFPLRCVVFMTPPAVLVLAALYAVRGHVGPSRQRLVWELLVIWTALPVLRVSMPNAGFYDANRHFIEYIPALCAMAGAGASLGLDWLARLPRHARAAEAAAIVALAGATVWPVATTHPFETEYFNLLAGGLGGAQRRGVLSADPPLGGANGSEADYWFNSLREALGVMRKLRHDGQKLGACGPWPAQVQVDWEFQEKLSYSGDQRGHIAHGTLSADLLYASPRSEGACSWRVVREWERTRPIFWRVERDGGLIYEIFGLPDGVRRPAVSPPTHYDPSARDTPAQEAPPALGRVVP